MILSGPAIETAVAAGDIVIDPPPAEYNPNSVNLRLGPLLKVYKAQLNYICRVDDRGYDGHQPPQVDWAADVLTGVTPYPYDLPGDCVLDPYKVNETVDVPIPPGGFVLLPGILYLGATIEQAGSIRYAPLLEGRSTWARLSLQTHRTGGWGDVGFAGTPAPPDRPVQWTLEIDVLTPVRVRAGDPICQIAFQEVKGPLRLYGGRYPDQTGPTPAKPLPKQE